ncbi:HYC_CC_PP family protein [Lacinutrix himadriensis]|uniref:HYC_CC_PP family protein n=1 Tax=Lacinutrix himadriensis TaxID=641549 RepID=UPI0006E2CD9E|nr:hypothetical protein [Lacinutrix himadriensis]
MIKQILHKSFSITLAFLVLFSTVSLTIEKHFCGDVLVDVSIFSEGENCGMKTLEMQKAAITKMNCCKNQVDVVQGQKDLAIKTLDDLEFEQQVFLASFTYAYINLFEGLPKQIIPNKDYAPPNIIVDIQLMNDTFLI